MKSRIWFITILLFLKVCIGQLPIGTERDPVYTDTSGNILNNPLTFSNQVTMAVAATTAKQLVRYQEFTNSLSSSGGTVSNGINGLIVSGFNVGVITNGATASQVLTFVGGTNVVFANNFFGTVSNAINGLQITGANVGIITNGAAPNYVLTFNSGNTISFTNALVTAGDTNRGTSLIGSLIGLVTNGATPNSVLTFNGSNNISFTNVLVTAADSGRGTSLIGTSLGLITNGASSGSFLGYYPGGPVFTNIPASTIYGDVFKASNNTFVVGSTNIFNGVTTINGNFLATNNFQTTGPVLFTGLFTNSGVFIANGVTNKLNNVVILSGANITGNTILITSLSTNGAAIGNTIQVAAAGPVWTNAASSSVFTEQFTSTNFGIGNSVTYTNAHGLTGMPTLIQVRLKNISPELGFLVNDEVVVNNNTSAGTGNGITVVPDATNVVLITQTSITLCQKDGSGGVNSITDAKWKLIVRAWR